MLLHQDWRIAGCEECVRGMRRELTVDVLIVGLGPAGACAAAAAALAGLRVLAIDRKSVAGVPVQCAEFVPAMIGAEIGALSRARRQSIRSMTTYIEAETPHIKGQFPGHMIDRAAFDAALVAEAIAAGADCRLGTVLRKLDGNGAAQLSSRRPFSPPLDGEGGAAEPRGWGGARGDTSEPRHPHPHPLPAGGWGDKRSAAERQSTPSVKEEDLAVRARVVIGADGPRSAVRRAIGQINRDVAETRQITVPLLEPFEATDIFLSAGIRGGYAWLFPKGDVANLGLGLESAARDRLKPLLESLHLRLVSEGRVGSEVLGHTGGAIPVGGILEPAGQLGEATVLLAGDAAGLTNPVTGAGINAAVISGTLAGEAAARICAGGADAAAGYAEELRDLFGSSLNRALARRRELMQTYATGGPGPADLERSWIAFPAYWAA